MDLEVEPRRLRFRAPIVTAYATYEERELLVVRVRDGDGLTGLGEAAPLEPFDGVSVEAVRAEVEGCRDVLAAGGEPARLRSACRRACSLPHAAAALDESAREPGALAAAAADAVCLRVGACGGVTAVLRDAATARAAGADVYLASTFDGPIGVAAGLHAAAALGVARPCGLATLPLFTGVADPFPVQRGTIHLPDAPGLGY